MTICSERAQAVTRVLIGCAIVLAAVAHVSAQGLGEVARAEEERRKTVKSAGKVYTNDRLRPDPTTPSQPAPLPQSSTSPAPAPADPAPKAGDAGQGARPAAKDEATWRDRIKVARENLERTKIMADALQSRINALNADFTARDDPAQRGVIASNLQRALGELDRTKKEIETQNKAIAQIQDEGRRAGVPAGWLR
jgi:hypothetical protein